MSRWMVMIAIAGLALLAACNSGGPTEQSVARVKVGAALDTSAPNHISPLGAPTDIETGVTGVTRAVLTVFRGGSQVYFDASGNEVDSGGVDIVLIPPDATTTLNLVHGTYTFAVSAEDDSSNVLADGEVANHLIEGPQTLSVALVSTVDSAVFSDPVMVMPNQVFDVFLTVSPQGRTDLRVPTSDYDAFYDVTSASGPVSTIGESDLGIRVIALCEDIDIHADVYRTGATQGTTTADRQIPIGYSCPAVGGTIGVDVVPPHIAINSHSDLDSIDTNSLVVLAGDVNDPQSGVDSVEIFDGVVLLGTAIVVDGANPGDMSTWSFNFEVPNQARTYQIMALATDGAGNQMQTVVSLVGQVGP